MVNLMKQNIEKRYNAAKYQLALEFKDIKTINKEKKDHIELMRKKT